MDDRVRHFKSHDGILSVDSNGVTIKRTFTQALKAGKLLQRRQFIPYSSMDKVGHRDALGKVGQLQFTIKPGTEGSTPLSRHPKIHFQAHQSHDFRHAQRIIQDRLTGQA